MFPKPMPVRHDAQVFPHFFAKSLNTPYLPLDKEIAPIEGNVSIKLKGILVFFFYIVNHIKESSDCVQLYNQSATWFDKPGFSHGFLAIYPLLQG